ncbi:uncharacterized protein si:ch211-158d24.4 [Danio aesculapii]|uniref:uncharacterized protein si:ch211-158d24.4 n=1 Tax=Danio aesculapii TaxID=1142201 RepID=UPI0024C0BE1E|nr:uncharacterized protein si:ch211-158d24.4 [Danio aesculapii]
MEKANEQADMVLIVSEPESRLRLQYRSLRRQVLFIQTFSVLFCVTCCTFTLMYHANASICKENITEQPPRTEMQRIEFNQRDTTFIRLKVKDRLDVKTGDVPWYKFTTQDLPDYSGYFTLAEDGKSLEVHRLGTYKVSLQITYRGLDNYINETILQQDIVKYPDGYDGRILLLTSTETLNFTSRYWRKSLLSEGIFSLQAGDKLIVASNNLPLIDISHQTTFFVVYPHFSSW